MSAAERCEKAGRTRMRDAVAYYACIARSLLYLQPPLIPRPGEAHDPRGGTGQQYTSKKLATSTAQRTAVLRLSKAFSSAQRWFAAGSRRPTNLIFPVHSTEFGGSSRLAEAACRGAVVKSWSSLVSAQ